jgi:8-oxo-dGTP diphosphatase
MPSVSKPMHECVAAILRRDGAVLLCHRTSDREWFPRVWDLPGGHVNTDETARDALVRELHEELGIDIVVPAEPPAATIDDPALDLHLSIWVIDDWRGEPTNLAQDEHDRVAWFAPDEFAALDLADDRYRSLLRRALAEK